MYPCHGGAHHGLGVSKKGCTGPNGWIPQRYLALFECVEDRFSEAFELQGWIRQVRMPHGTPRFALERMMNAEMVVRADHFGTGNGAGEQHHRYDKQQ